MFNQRLWFHSFSKVCFLCTMSYSDVTKHNTACKWRGWREGGQRGDWFSLCTSAVALEMGWLQGWEEEERHIMLHLQSHSNLVNLFFPFSFLFLSLPFSLSNSHFFPAPPWSRCLFSFLFALDSASLSLFLFSFALLQFTSLLYLRSSLLAGTAVLLSNLTSARMGQILQWSRLHLAVHGEREKKHTRERWR